MSTTTEITMQNWLKVRNEIAAELKQVSPQSQKAIEQSEHLISLGIVDVDHVLATIQKRDEPPKPKLTSDLVTANDVFAKLPHSKRRPPAPQSPDPTKGTP